VLPIDIRGLGLNYMALAPEIVLTTFALIVLLWDLWTEEKRKLAYVALTGVVVSLVAVVFSATDPTIRMGADYFGGMVAADMFGFYMKAVLLLIAGLVILLSVDFVEQNLPKYFAEFYEILLFATLGMMFMVGSKDLLMIYLGLEVVSIGSYVLAGVLRKDPRSGEAALKYFLNGALASAILLFGLSLIYGLTGTTYLPEIAFYLSELVTYQFLTAVPIAVAGIIMLVAGFAFKIAAAPFHLWAPDVYHGAPTPITGFFSVGPKGAAFAALLRVFVVGFGAAPWLERWSLLFAVLAAASMFLGNLTALMQTNIKRMMAYSSIAQAGYVLIGVVAAGTAAYDKAVSAVLFYVAGYAITNLGIFTILTHMDQEGGWQEVSDFNGLARRNPVYAWALLFFFVSLIGIPPTVGFFGKFFLFQAALEGGLLWLAILMAVNSVISVGYYYGVVRAMFMEEPVKPALQGSPNSMAAVVITFISVIAVGLLANPLISLALSATGMR
jgi:NADH-quinone oxidoreductase subunit N